ncbi:MAG: D-alanyl-D-alanine carboxypeptidase [Blautia sp.]|nr:D-alanyl-D-alanine carboxypeptidase [Blautia sp.]
MKREKVCADKKTSGKQFSDTKPSTSRIWLKRIAALSLTFVLVSSVCAEEYEILPDTELYDNTSEEVYDVLAGEYVDNTDIAYDDSYTEPVYETQGIESDPNTEADADSINDMDAVADPVITDDTGLETEVDYSVPSDTVSSEPAPDQIEGWPAGPTVTAGDAVLLECETGTLLYSRNMDETVDPGSTVKVLTTLLALEHCDLSDEVTMTQTGVSGVTDSGLNISTQLGEIFTMEQCLYAIVLYSANDIALQVAEYIGGSVEEFVRMMNQRAQELGCKNSLFTNPTGLEDPAQHSTAYDMALIMRAAIQNPSFCTIAAAQTYTIPATNLSGGTRTLTNSFALTNPSSAYYYEDCIGGKEGYTATSGSSLICAAKSGGITLVCSALLGTPNQTEPDAVSLLDYGYDNFELQDLGRDNFDVISGGIILVPAGTRRTSLTYEDQESPNGILRTYLFNGKAVGTAIVNPLLETNEDAIREGNAFLEEARQYSAGKKMAPYYIIIGIGLLLSLLLFIRMIKLAKEK